MVLYSDQCYNSCPAQTYLSTNPVLNCVDCGSNCMNCSSGGCSVCLQGYMLNISTGQCSNQCPAGYYAGKTCATCAMSCIACAEPNCATCDSTTCQLCSNGFYLYNGACINTCPVGTYVNGGNSCIDCTMPGCRVCTSSNCQNCIDTLLNVYANGSSAITSCESTCPNSHFLSNGKDCTVCPSLCKVCSSTSNCTECITGDFLYNYQCYSRCPDGSYPIATAGTCGPCHQGCTTCNSLTNCTSCGQYYSLVNDLCIQPNCEHCDNCTNNYCFNCTAPYLQLNGTCLTECPVDHYFANETNCVDCMANCLICPNASYCQICVDGYNFTNETNECILEAIFVYGKVANMSSFTSNLTATMSAVYLSSSAGPTFSAEMSMTYFVI